MIPVRTMTALLLAAPAIAFGQVTISEIRIVPDPMLPMDARQACIDRVNSLHDRKASLDEFKLDVDREGAAIAAAGAQLEDELRRLNPTDRAAVAAYNARSQDHNLRVDAQNRRVAQLNDAAGNFNAQAGAAMRFCRGT